MLNLNVFKTSTARAALEVTTHPHAIALAMIFVSTIIAVVAGVLVGSPMPILVAPSSVPGGGSGGG